MCYAATCILFGDGTGAVVLTAQQGQCSLLGMDSHSDGAGQRHLNVSSPVKSACWSLPTSPAGLLLLKSLHEPSFADSYYLCVTCSWLSSVPRAFRAVALHVASAQTRAAVLSSSMHCVCPHHTSPSSSSSSSDSPHAYLLSILAVHLERYLILSLSARLSLNLAADCTACAGVQCHFSQSGLKPLNNQEASAEGAFANIKMSGQEVFRFAVRAVPLVSVQL